jgi:hypothetical protein
MNFFKKSILRRDQGKTKYLVRYTIIGCRLFSIKLHHTLADDPADLHDHPWTFLSIILWGGYYEWTNHVRIGWDTMTQDFTCIEDRKKTWYGPGSILYRPASKPHSLELKKVWDRNVYNSPDERMFPNPKRYNSVPCWSLVFTGPKFREWGFIQRGRWRSHKEAVVNY